MVKTTLQQEEQNYSMIFGESCCGSDLKLDVSDLEESILEIQSMLDYSISISDQKEVKSWRRMLQQAKTQRRELLTT